MQHIHRHKKTFVLGIYPRSLDLKGPIFRPTKKTAHLNLAGIPFYHIRLLFEAIFKLTGSYCIGDLSGYGSIGKIFHRSQRYFSLFTRLILCHWQSPGKQKVCLFPKRKSPIIWRTNIILRYNNVSNQHLFELSIE